ncbi:MAG: SDR family NAD(P)-dependent oxidoreductase, partial [Janthinobacterium sp.]
AVRAMAADLAAPADLRRVAEELAGNPAITMLVNNAGVSTLGAVVDAPREGIAAMDQVNVAALAQLTYAVLPQFKQRN